MSKHTPGPWQADTEFPDRLIVPDFGRIWINGYDSEGAPVHIGYVDGPRTVERMANASLIAAAPELLEALQDAIALYGKFGAIVNDPHAPGEWINQARAAIAKAEGDTP